MGSNMPPSMPQRDLTRASATHAARFRLPFQLHRANLDGIARFDPGLDELTFNAQLAQVALEALGRFLVVEVGLGGEALDSFSDDSVGVVLPANGEDVGPRFETVDDHA